MKICQSCGKPIDENSRFCEYCGQEQEVAQSVQEKEMVVKSCYLARFIDGEEVLKEYTEELGCKIKHKFVPAEGIFVYTIEDAIGNQSVLIIFPEPLKSQLRGMCGTRVVVDNIQEGIEYFKKKGYAIFADLMETESNFCCSMRKGDEFRLIFEHKKNHK